MKRLATGVRVAALLIAAATAPALAEDASSAPSPDDPVLSAMPSEEPSTVPEELQGMVGDWLLEQDDESAPKCPITLTDQQSIGGWAVAFPEACPAPYPADKIMTWNVNPEDGSVLLTDAERHVVLQLFEDEDGLFDTDPNTPPQFFLLPPEDTEGNGGENDAE